MRDPKLYLKDILEAIEAIEKFVGGMDFETFKNDDMRVSAVIRKFEIIGEASKNVPEGIKQKHSSIPWSDMAGMRDRLIHFYFGIKYELIWNAIKEGTPRIKPLIRKILEDLEAKK
ncbi:MAG TPA: HepT-like ribonuclease domain-containing protein [Candidatus Hypogeohydataceae bacterium YC38]